MLESAAEVMQTCNFYLTHSTNWRGGYEECGCSLSHLGIQMTSLTTQGFASGIHACMQPELFLLAPRHAGMCDQMPNRA